MTYEYKLVILRKIVILFLCLSTGLLFAAFLFPENGGKKAKLRKAPGIDYSTNFDVNNIRMVTTNLGSICHEILTNTGGLEYPKCSGNLAIFAAGILAGGMVGEELRMANSTFDFEYQPGNIIGYNEESEEIDFANQHDEQWGVFKLNRGDSSENPDYNNWLSMAQFGAPLTKNGNPKITGDQALWTIFHDADRISHTNSMGGTLPLNIEIKSYIFGYNTIDPLKNAVFIQLEMSNKGTSEIRDFYFSFWADPDLGDPANDVIGIDLENDLSFVYNYEYDQIYDDRNVCLGIDLLKGLRDDNDRQLSITAFNTYLRGIEPGMAMVTYNLMRGLMQYGDEYQHPYSGKTVRHVFNGDPVKGTGWIDRFPGDKRIILTSGPKTFLPGDTDTFELALVFGIHDDYLKAISAMKYNDYFVKKMYENGFTIPDPPPAPEVTVFAAESEIYLSWNSDIELYDSEGYEFQGYNVYVTNRWNPVNSFDWKIVDTYDKVDGIRDIIGVKFNESTGEVEEGTVIKGRDTGIKRWKKIVSDEWRGGGKSLIPEKDYYYAIAAYVVNPSTNSYIESEMIPITVTPKSSPPGYDYSDVYTSVEGPVTHAAGQGSGKVNMYLLNPDNVKGGEYKVTFSGSPEEENMKWSLSRDSDELISYNSNFSGDWNYPVVDGIQVVVEGKDMLPVTFSDYEWNGNVRIESDINTDFPSGRIKEVFGVGGERSVPYLGNDIEIRFTADIDTTGYGQTGTYNLGAEGGSLAQFYTDFYQLESISSEKIKIPFEIWDSEENIQVNCIVLLPGGSGNQWKWDVENFLAVIHKPYDPDNTLSLDDSYTTWCLKLAPGNGLPRKGDYIKLEYERPLSAEDIFSFTLSDPVKKDLILAKRDFLEKVKVVPNPYYGFSNYEVSYEYKVLKFINLPVEPVTITIFNMYGTIVRTIKKNGPDTTVDWDLKSESGNTVASSIYIYHINSSGYGSIFGKFVIFMEDTRDYY